MSFGRVVAYAAVALIVIFVVAYIYLRKDHTVPGRYNKYPTSRLSAPAAPPWSPTA